ncbi:helix-turn-helix transcriptional regulator [Tomitella biformata]|uniref:helix-turn-helix transcriptional regulator n=1 Tax=Tomitella biformata TaxID=630403 RepID=UPI0004646E8F|nr:helix-turn-helix transcriptional regulator [Tomitella biformata]
MSETLQGNRVREHRRAARLTQSELGAAVGVSRQTIVSMEGGKYSPSVYLALRLARHLGVSVETLFAIPEEA